MKDGTTYKFAGGYATSISDRNGNTISYTYTGVGGSLTGITDALGRQYGVQLNLTDSGSGRQYDQLSYPGVGGVTRYIKIYYDVLSNILRSDQSIQNDNQLWPGVLGVNQIPSTVGGTFLSEILLPDGSSYNFKRDSYGNVAEVLLPTGGMVQYDWAGQVGAVGGSQVSVAPVSYSLRCYLTQRREYSNSNASSLYRVTKYSGATVTEYDGNNNLQAETVHTIVTPAWPPNLHAIDYDIPNAGQEPTTQYYDKNGTTLLRQIARTYQERSCTGDATCWWLTNQNYTRPPHDYLPWQETTTEGSVTKQTVSLYDQYNNENNKTESDWGSGTSGGPVLRQILTTYNTGASYISANILNLPTEVQILNGAGTKLADTTYSYDQTALTADSSIIGYHAPSTPRGNRTTITECVNVASCSAFNTTYAFDVAGNVVSVTDGDNHTTTLSYADNYVSGSQNTYAHVTSITNALGQTATWQYDYDTGHVMTATDVNGVPSTYAYADPLDRVTNITKASGTSAATEINVTYTGTTEVDVYGDQVTPNDQALHTATLYDGFGRESVKKTYESASSVISTTKTYDALGRVSTSSNPSRGGDGLGYLTTYLYDGLGRPLSVTTADGAIASTSYSGNSTTTTDQAGKQRTTVTDGPGRLTSVVEDPGTGHLNYSTSYGYDALDDLVSVSQSTESRSFAYDAMKRLLAAYNPENSSASAAGHLSCAHASGSSWTTCYSYDNVGNLLVKTDNRNATISYSYDALNRVLSKTYGVPSGVAATPNVSYCYDAPYTTSCPTTAVAGYKGRLTEVTNGNSATLYSSFDGLGRVKSQSQVTNGNTYNFSYTYNLAGSVTSESYPSGRLVNTCYDLANRVWQVGLGACPTTAGSTTGLGLPAYATGAQSNTGIQYAPHGAPTQYALGNNVWHEPTYNSRLQMSGFQDLQNGTTSLLNATLNWGAGNNNGNLQSASYLNSGPGFSSNLTLNQSYFYDGVNRLTNVTDTGYSRSFGYDAFGNMYISAATVITPAGNAPQAAGLYNGNNQFTSGTYDAAGNEAVVNGNTITYDAENRQTSVVGTGVSETYAYDGDGRRISKVGGGVTTVFVYDAAGRMSAEYSTAFSTSNCVTCYMSPDQLGTARLVTDQSGNPVARHDYLPFGEEVGANAGRGSQWAIGNDSINQKFTGKERDTESGLDYFGARYYASSMGRFMSPDWSAKVEPVPYSKLDDPQTLNLYAYARNNPLSNVDVDGHETEQEKQAKIAAAAKAQNGSTSYNINTTNVSNMQIFKPGSDKCNEFVADTVKSADGTRPVVDGTGKIPTAAQFADPNVKITGLSAPEPLANAKPGDIIAQDHGPGKNGNEEGHVGIVVGLPHDGQPGQTASTNANVGGRVTVNDWGFRSPTASPNNGERNGASSPAPVVRHPLGDPQ